MHQPGAHRPAARTLPPTAGLSAMLLAATLGACSLMPDTPTIGLSNLNQAPADVAVAHIAPLAGSEVTGMVTFSRKAGDTLVEVNLSHLAPGQHGFHVHEKADCSSADGLSAGGHYNPTGVNHGGPEMPHHVGDLGNITAGADGTVNINFHVKNLDVSGEHGVVGHAIIIHAAPDDFTTQPSGNSGKRLGCGIIAHS